jgi:hypothetical protein
MNTSGIATGIIPHPYTQAQSTAAHQGAAAAAAVQAAQAQGLGSIAFDPTSQTGAEDARSRVAGALAVSPAKTQTAAPAVPDTASVSASASNSAVAGAVQTISAPFQPYASNAQQQPYGNSLPRGNTVDAVA